MREIVWNAHKSYFGDMKKKFYGVYPVGTITRHPAKRSYRQPRKLGRRPKQTLLEFLKYLK